MLHEDSNHNIDQDELGHEDEHDEEHGRDILINAAVPQTVLGVVTLLPQSVLHNSVPVVSCDCYICHPTNFVNFNTHL